MFVYGYRANWAKGSHPQDEVYYIVLGTITFTLPDKMVDIWVRAVLFYKSLHGFDFDETRSSVVAPLQTGINKILEMSRRRWLTHHCLLATEGDAVS